MAHAVLIVCLISWPCKVSTLMHLSVGGSISPGASASLRLRAPTVSAILAEARPVTETMSPAPATSKSMRPVPDRFQIFVSLPSSPVPPTIKAIRSNSLKHLWVLKMSYNTSSHSAAHCQTSHSLAGLQEGPQMQREQEQTVLITDCLSEQCTTCISSSPESKD